MAGLLPFLQGGGPPPAAITTRAVPGQGVWLRGPDGWQTQVGRFDPGLPGPENRMRPLAAAFAAAGAAALQACAAAPGEWAVIDEIGYLETASPAYCAALLTLMRTKRVAAVVRKQDLPFLRQLCRRADAFVVDLDAPYGRAGCVIMASGLGRRFGGGKLLAPLAGRPLLQYALDATAGIFAARVVVTRDAAAAALCQRQAVPVLLHDQPRRSDTVRLGLRALADQAAGGAPLTGCLFCPADQPLLRRQTAAALAVCAAADPQAIWRTAWQGRPGAPVLFPAWAFAELLALPAGQGGGAVARAHPDRVRALPVQAEWELADADTPQQLAALQSLAQDGEILDEVRR